MTDVEISKLKNGITIVSECLPYVESFSLGFWFDVGSRDETKVNNGISHFLEHMFFKGTTNRTAKKISDEIESLGGYLNAFTSKEHTCLYGRGLKSHLNTTFEVLADMVLNSLFAEEEIKKEARVIVDELYDIEDSPEELIFDIFESNVYAGSRLSQPIIGTEKNITSFTRDDLVKYIGKNYSFKNMYIVASGNVSHENLLELAEKYITKSFGKATRRRGKIEVAEPTTKYVKKDISQTHVILGQPTYGYESSKRVQAAILSHILGEGSSSRLFYAVREKNGITYQINTFLNSFYDISSFGVYFSTNEKSVPKATDLILKEFEKIKKKPVTQKELVKSKESIKGSILMGLESLTNRMMRMGQSIIYNGRVKSVNDSINEINSVTQEEILNYANNILLPEQFSKVIIGNSENSAKVEKELKS